MRLKKEMGDEFVYFRDTMMMMFFFFFLSVFYFTLRILQ